MLQPAPGFGTAPDPGCPQCAAAKRLRVDDNEYRPSVAVPCAACAARACTALQPNAPHQQSNASPSSASPPQQLLKPRRLFGGAESEDGNDDDSAAGGDSRSASPDLFTDSPTPPPPALTQTPPSATVVAAQLPDTRFPSPGLALASARMITGRSGLSACASVRAAPSSSVGSFTPSRQSLPARPPTPGAPGSSMRRTMSCIDALRSEDDPSTMSLTDAVMNDAVMSTLTQGFTAIALGSKRTAEERDQ